MIESEVQTAEDGPFAAAITSLGIGRTTVSRILANHEPRKAWQAIVDRNHPADPDGTLSKKADPEWPDLFARRLEACGAEVLIRGRAAYPEILEDDLDSPEVLFCLGHPEAMSGRARVAVVGTRAATRYGAEVAAELGSGLASANVTVVSGLAAGIDAAAHMGVVRLSAGAPPVAVIATGIDVIYPRSNRLLRDAVAERGVVVSELPPGGLSERWRFADRNRLMAALAHVVVVVECHHSGGALYTVRAAKQRGIDVMAVPGSVRSPASVGTNALLADGMPPAPRREGRPHRGGARHRRRYHGFTTRLANARAQPRKQRRSLATTNNRDLSAGVRSARPRTGFFGTGRDPKRIDDRRGGSRSQTARRPDIGRRGPRVLVAEGSA